jgi:hypothetical protein
MQRTAIQLLAAIARFSPAVIAPILGDVVPGVLKASSQDDDEQRESSLQVWFLSRMVFLNLFTVTFPDLRL